VFTSAPIPLFPYNDRPKIRHGFYRWFCWWLFLAAATGCGSAPAVSHATAPAAEAALIVTALPSAAPLTAEPRTSGSVGVPGAPALAATSPPLVPPATITASAAAATQTTATAVPSLTPTGTATAGAPPVTPESSVTAEASNPAPLPEYPAGTNPLTGQRVADPALLERRPIAVKVSNYPPQVRPQYGLNQADLIFEHYAEAGVTRLTAVFYSRDADRVGSIRSGRLIDLEIPVMYDAAFAYSGAVGPIRLLIRDSAFFSRVISPDFAHGGFFRVEEEGKAFEHTLYTGTRTLRHMLEARGENRPPLFHNYMDFQPQAPAGGTAVSRLEIRYLGTNAFWQYNSGGGRYTRWTDGQPHLDAATGQQLNFRNVVVLGAHHQESDIVEDRGGNLSIQIQVWGEGPVSIFRDGRRYEGRWRRLEPDQMLTFYDLQGHSLPLAPGNTFFQLVPLGFTGLVASP
jgi:hypothetical protein